MPFYVTCMLYLTISGVQAHNTGTNGTFQNSRIILILSLQEKVKVYMFVSYASTMPYRIWVTQQDTICAVKLVQQRL